MSAVYSMTGFATVNGPGFTLTVKSVNHRFLDLQVRVPSGSDGLEAGLRAIVRASVRRGHVELTLQVDASTGTSISVKRNDELLGALVGAFREAAEVHGLEGEPDLNVLLRIPGVISSEVVRASVPVGAVELGAAAETLMLRFNEARAVEGAALAAEMLAAMERLLALTEEMAVLRVGVREGHIARLRGRLLELLEGVDVAEERVLAEAAMLAERSDVEEEIVRLRTHAVRFKAILDEGGEVGKSLDFLLQEMNREANTMVSKVNGAMGERGLQLTAIGLAMKGEIEKVKEQVQNLE